MEKDPPEPADSRAERRASLFLDRLDKYGSFERAPKGFRGAWEAVQRAEVDSTPRIFLEAGGPLAWFAFLVLKNSVDSSKHFTGKSECRQMLRELENEPADSNRAVAEELHCRASADMQMKVASVLNRFQDPPERDRPASPNKRQRVTTETIDTRLILNLSTPPVEVEVALPQGDAPSHADLYVTEKGITPRSHVLAHASLDAVIRIFPQDLADAIVRHSDHDTFAAGISMCFPNVPREENSCHMTVEITYEKAPRLVQGLFRVDLETKGRLRYASLASGITIVPNPRITFHQCHLETIESLFGPEITCAIHESPEYTQDEKQRRHKTQSIWVDVSCMADDPITINMSLGLWHGTQIAQKLFPRR
ncbi:hypothetical protein F4679DRAFT_222177 [Xylaria curta]|nr:hypothetical protein F4679DRAFT_222177 [Xylaria curta]